MTATRRWIVGHSRAIAWTAVAAAVPLLLAYPILFYLDASARPEVFGIPGIDELVVLVATVAGALIVARQPCNAVGWMLLFEGLSGLVGNPAQLYSVLANRVHHGAIPGGAFSAWLGGWLFFPGIALLTTLVLLLFPDGRLPSPRWRWVLWATAAAVAAATLGLAVGTIPNSAHFAVDAGGGVRAASRLADDQGVTVLAFLASPVCLAALIVRFRRSRGEERQQLKWFTYGGVLLVLGIAVSVVSVLNVNAPSGDSGTPMWAAAIQELTSMAIPIAIGIAVLRYRLYDIDVVISRTLVYGTLGAFITAVYVAIVVGIGTLVGSGNRPNLVLSIVATAVVAVAFQPARERVQRVANRLVYGRRATPYEVLSEFSQRVAESYAGEQVLPRMAQVLAEGTGAQAASVWLRSSRGLRPAAAWPASINGRATQVVALTGQLLPEMPEGDRAVPVRHQGELLGALTVTKRSGESLTPIEEKLLQDLAHQAGLVLRNVGLTADLQARLEDLRASRQRLVAAQDHERRRLERNLHDGAQQHLVAIKVKLGLAENLATRDPDRAVRLLEQLKADADEALTALRDLARGIYPPLLADRGLATALESQARKATLPVRVESRAEARYPQEVEAAVYFCCLEGLQNVQKYARATAATVRLEDADGVVAFEVQDDGVGFDPAATTRGSGLQNIEDRLDALGGGLTIRAEPGRGTVLRGWLPVQATGAR